MGPPPLLAAQTCARRLRPVTGLGAVDAAVSWFGPAAYPPERPGSEAVVQGLTGMMAVHGRDRGTPRRLGLEAASVAAGLLAAQGVLAAAVGGTAVPSTSVLQAGLLLLSNYFVVATELGDALDGMTLPAPGPPFASADGQWFEIETLDPEAWRELWRRLGVTDAEAGRAWTVFRWRYERAACSLPAALHAATVARPLAELRQVAADAGVSLVALRAYAEASAAQLGVPHADGVPPIDGGLPIEAPRRGLPLEGVRVVEATNRIQGPLAGMLVRMLGAESVRVQPPEGDYGRAALCLHRRKRAVQLDLGTRAGRDELDALLGEADVFLHNWRPGRAEEWGFGHDQVAARHPRLVHAELSGWGRERVDGNPVGTDFLVQAHAGLGEGLNPDGEAPFPARIILSDLFGGLLGAEAVLAGLCRRERTGSGSAVRSSLWDGAMALQAHRDAERPSWGPLDRPIPCGGGWIAITVDHGEGFSRVCDLFGIEPGQASSAEAEEAAEVRVAAELAKQNPEGVVAELTAQGVPAAVVAPDLAAVAADPALAGCFERVGSRGVAPRSPWDFA